MISSKVVLAVPILLAAAVFSSPVSSRALLTILLVYALKLQLRLAREIQPRVNLPPPPPANAIQADTRHSARVRQTGTNARDDINSIPIEVGQSEESQPRQAQLPQRQFPRRRFTNSRLQHLLHAAVSDVGDNHDAQHRCSDLGIWLHPNQ